MYLAFSPRRMPEFAAARFTVPKHLRVMVASDAKPQGVAVMKRDDSALDAQEGGGGRGGRGASNLQIRKQLIR